jgi:hypothetical protein
MQIFNKPNKRNDKFKLTSLAVEVGIWLLFIRILNKYNKRVSSLLNEYIEAFVKSHFHILMEDPDIYDIMLANPGIQINALGRKLYESRESKRLINRFGRTLNPKVKTRKTKSVDMNTAKVIDDKGMFL